MSNNDLISREALKNEFRAIYHCADTVEELANTMEDVIDNAPTVATSKIEYKAYNEGFKDGVEQGIRLSESPAGRCKSCKYYHPYYEQLTNIPRGDGYCVIARMTPEGMTTINCNDEFGCSDYEKGGAE